MAVSPDIVRTGQGGLRLQLAIGQIEMAVELLGGLTYPNNFVSGGDIQINCRQVAGNSGSIWWGLAVVEDIVDTDGDYTQSAGSDAPTASGVHFYQTLGTQSSFPQTVTVPELPKGGVYRLVLTAGDNANNARRRSNVNTGGTSLQYHMDSDGNNSRGGSAIISINNSILGVVGRKVQVSTLTPTSGNWRYGQTNQIALNLRPAGNPTGQIVNPKELKVALSADQSGVTRPDGVYRITPNTTGAATATGIRVDTDFNQTIGGVDHYIQIGINDTFGDTTTPANEQAGIYNVGATVEGVTASQKSPYVFDDGIITESITISQVRSNTASVKISSAIQIFETDALSTAGALSFKTNAYSLRQDIFRRKGPTITTNAIPYLETYVTDAYGQVLPNTDVTAITRRVSNNSSENTQDLSTDANGRVRWNYVLSSSAPAFNRYVKVGATRASDGHVGAGPDSTTGWSYFYSNINSDYPDDYEGPCPGYPRKVEVVGRQFGTKEPTITDNNVFGVSSEIVFEDLWTGTLSSTANQTIVLEQTVQAQGGSGSTITSPSINGGVNMCYIAVISNGNANPRFVDMVTGLGLTWTKIRGVVGARLNSAVSIWYAVGSPASGTVTATFSGTAENRAMVVARYSGVDQNLPIEDSDVADSNTNGGLNPFSVGTIQGTSPEGRFIGAINSVNADPEATNPANQVATVPQSDCRLEVFDGVADETNLFTGDHGGSKTDWVAVCVTLRPTVTPLNDDGVPIGSGLREQTLGSGSLRAKLSSDVNEANLKIFDIDRFNGKDVAGRIIPVTTDNLFLSRAVLNLTSNTVIDSGSALSASTDLNNSLGYRSGVNSLDTIAPPIDPASLMYWQAAADTTAQRGSFSMTGKENVGFTLDNGNFGYLSQGVSFAAIDPTIKLLLVPEVVQTDPTLIRRFKIKMFRLTRDPLEPFVDVNADEAPTYAVYASPKGGAVELLTFGTAISIGTEPSPDWEFDVEIPLGYSSIKVYATALVAGSRTIGGDIQSTQIGYEFDTIGTFTGFHFK